MAGPSAGRGIDEVAAELYSASPSGFVAARDEAVRQARDAGDRDLARQIGRLRKPTVAAWAVNLLVRSSPAQVDDLLALGERLRAAQQRLQGDQLRQLNQQRRETVGALSRRAAQLAAEAGSPLSGSAVVEVEQTLAAALAEEESAQALRQGRLTKALQHVGMGAEPLLTPTLTVAPDDAAGAANSGAGVAPSDGARDAQDTQDTVDARAGEDELTRRRKHRDERREQEMHRAAADLEQARERLDAAERDARQAEQRAVKAERKLAKWKQERDEAVRERDEARRRARSAVRVRDDAQRRVQRLADRRDAP